MRGWIAALSVLLTGCVNGAKEPEDSGAHALLQSSAVWARYGLQDGAELHARTGPHTDVDGDGLPDLIADSPRWDGAFADEGRCAIFVGGVSEPAPLVTWSVFGGQADAMLRCWPAGDVDGDGFGDVLAVSPGWSGAEVGSGRIELFCGAASLPSTTPCWTWEPPQADAGLDAAVSVGDLNGDGSLDVAAVAAGWDAAFVDEGGVFVFLGTGTGLPDEPDWTWTCGSADCGTSGVWPAGDVDGDGFHDLLVGSPGYSGAFAGEGRVDLFAGGAAGLGGSRGGPPSAAAPP